MPKTSRFNGDHNCAKFTRTTQNDKYRVSPWEKDIKAYCWYFQLSNWHSTAKYKVRKNMSRLWKGSAQSFILTFHHIYTKSYFIIVPVSLLNLVTILRNIHIYLTTSAKKQTILKQSQFRLMRKSQRHTKRRDQESQYNSVRWV